MTNAATAESRLNLSKGACSDGVIGLGVPAECRWCGSWGV